MEVKGKRIFYIYLDRCLRSSYNRIKEIEKEMLKDKIDLEIIIKCIGLTKEEIENET